MKQIESLLLTPTVCSVTVSDPSGMSDQITVPTQRSTGLSECTLGHPVCEEAIEVPINMVSSKAKRGKKNGLNKSC